MNISTELQQFNLAQKEAFSHENIMTLLQQRSQFYDGMLLHLWQEFGLDKRDDLSLIAVGGYGRQEMFPLSDVDILVLTQSPVDDVIRDQLNQLFNQLWDAKLQVGASIRTLEECLSVGQSEISVATNMYEGRFLAGNATLWQTLKEALYQPDFWAIETFYQAKIEEQQARYARYHNTSYNLEPDLKHSPGGLRDLHLLSWISLRAFGIYSLEALLNKGVLFPEEYQELKKAEQLLFKMRFALHLQLKRYDNRLRFDRQLQLSEQLGYQGEGNQPVEAMMKAFFQATQSISQLSQLLLRSLAERLFISQKKGEIRPLDEHYALQCNEIICLNRRCFTQSSHTILDLFLHLTQNPEAKVEVNTLRYLRIALQKLTAPLSDSLEARTKFIQLFSQPKVVERAIVPMHQLGVLKAYLPQWQGIQGLMQFDLFHIYTVDEHTVRVMLYLEHFLDKETEAKHPLCCQLFQSSVHKPLLYLSALFHDIAKGREGEHADVGAVDMLDFAIAHGFNAAEAEQMAWLVKSHLMMSITAQRRDIHDPDVVKAFAKNVQNQTALADLLCLTVADICATNETLWNDWKRTLFTQLYEFTLAQLAERLNYQRVCQQHKTEAEELMKFAISASERKQLQAFWQPCPDSYFLRNNAKQLVWHALSYLKQPKLPMVLVSNEYARGATEIFIYCQDQAHLLAKMTQVISQKKLSIHNAQIITCENMMVLDSFIVTESNGAELDELRCQQVQNALQTALEKHEFSGFKLQKKPVKHQSFQNKTTVRFLANSQPNQTAFELSTSDREGLLAQITEILSQQNLALLNAKITTIGEKVEDFFVVQTAEKAALNKEQQKALKTSLCEALDV